MLEQSLVLIASFLAALVLTPLVRTVAIRWGIVDHPDPHRKLHGRVVARAGGSAVLLSLLIVCFAAIFRYDLTNLTARGAGLITPYVALLTVMIGIWLLGLADDIWVLRGRQKLLGQILLAGILVFAGFQIEHVALFGYDLDLGVLSIPISMVWLLATTNALNLIDGADGLCATLGAIISGALGVLASVNGHFAEAAIAFSLCGALLGFLVFNFPPASIFLGDSGSLLIGMITGALAIRCALKGPATVAFLAPVAILSIPLLDSVMAIIRRKMTGRSIYTTDRAHLHHTLKNRGLSDRGMLLVVTVLTLITAAGALVGSALGRDWLAPVSVAVVIGILIVTKAFGYAEMVLIARRTTHFAMSMVEPARRGENITRGRSVRLQGTREWETVWEILVDFAEQHGLSKLHMDLNVPWLEEGFHGTWQRSRLPDRLERWSTSLPLHGSGRIAGRLDITGPALDGQALGTLGKLLELLDDLRPRLESLMEPRAADEPQASSSEELTVSSALTAAR